MKNLKGLTWDEVEENLSEMGHLDGFNLIFEGETSLENYVDWGLIKFFYGFDYFDLDEKVFELISCCNVTIREIPVSKIVHKQYSIEAEKVRNLFEIVEDGLWNDCYLPEELPEAYYIECLDKYVIQNGNHRTSLAHALEMETIKVAVYEFKPEAKKFFEFVIEDSQKVDLTKVTN